MGADLMMPYNPVTISSHAPPVASLAPLVGRHPSAVLVLEPQPRLRQTLAAAAVEALLRLTASYFYFLLLLLLPCLLLLALPAAAASSATAY